MESAPRYIPQLRTALVLAGTGTAGAYHAGVLRSLHEAGVKIDLLAGRGVGTIGAMFGAIDGAERLWESDGVWRSARVTRLYRWRWSLRVAVLLVVAAFSAIMLPVVALTLAALASPAVYFLQFLGVDVGGAASSSYGGWLDTVFSPSGLPTYVPRLVVLAVTLLFVLLGFDAAVIALRRGVRRRARGGLWWRLLGNPLDRTMAVEWFTTGLWQAMRGAATVAKPVADDLGERYSELLSENLGQPGFRELIVLTHDLDARRDVVFALVSDPYHSVYVKEEVTERVAVRPLEMIDLRRAPGRHAMDALTAALSVPIATEPHLVRYPSESVWKGEAHRSCDRLDGMSRLLEEVARAGVEQVIIVSALPPATGPHTLAADRRGVRARAGQYLQSLETTALHDAVVSQASRFQAIFHIRPTHNPLGPFDFGGCYDEYSDRYQTLIELVDRGYDDGFRQFVDAVVGASGELIDIPSVEGLQTNPSLSEQLAAHKTRSGRQ